MLTKTEPPDLWTLIRGTPWIDPDSLLAAIERQCLESSHDFRTRLLLRDAASALQKRWGIACLDDRLSTVACAVLDRIRAEELGEPGFPTLEKRMAEATTSRTILQFLHELGNATPTPARLEVGGSIALILRGLLTRGTDDIDAVDEVPASLRIQHDLLDRLSTRFGLRLTHFQSHYLPAGWEKRVSSLDRFGKLDVFLIDPIDIFVGKLFSNREKDRDDLRALQDSFPRSAIAERFRSSASRLMADPILRPSAERNWSFIFGEQLPAS